MTQAGSRQAEVESFILAELARREGCTSEELRAQLLENGAEMAYDSIVLVAMMTKVEAEFGVRLQVDLSLALAMRSVRSFAERVCQELANTTAEPTRNRSEEDKE